MKRPHTLFSALLLLCVALSRPNPAMGGGGTPPAPTSLASLIQSSDVVVLVRVVGPVEWHHPDPSMASTIQPIRVHQLVVDEALKGQVDGTVLLRGMPPASISNQPILAFLKETGNPGIYNRCCGDSFLRSDLFGDITGESGPLTILPDGALEQVVSTRSADIARVEQRFPMLLDETFQRPSTFEELVMLDRNPASRTVPAYTSSERSGRPGTVELNDDAEPGMAASTSFLDVLTVARALVAHDSKVE